MKTVLHESTIYNLDIDLQASEAALMSMIKGDETCDTSIAIFTRRLAAVRSLRAILADWENKGGDLVITCVRD